MASSPDQPHKRTDSAPAPPRPTSTFVRSAPFCPQFGQSRCLTAPQVPSRLPKPILRRVHTARPPTTTAFSTFDCPRSRRFDPRQFFGWCQGQVRGAIWTPSGSPTLSAWSASSNARRRKRWWCRASGTCTSPWTVCDPQTYRSSFAAAATRTSGSSHSLTTGLSATNSSTMRGCTCLKIEVPRSTGTPPVGTEPRELASRHLVLKSPSSPDIHQRRVGSCSERCRLTSNSRPYSVLSPQAL